MINDTCPWPPRAYRLPTAEAPATCPPTARAVPPPDTPPRPDVVGNLTRTMRAKAAARRAAPPPVPLANPPPRGRRGFAAGLPRRPLTPEEDAAVRQVAALISEEARQAGYAELADRFGVALRTVQIRAWWLRTEGGADG